MILLDIMMPGKSGFEVLEDIRKNEKTKTMPVILLTALSGREDRIKGIDAGADDFISKPFDKAELLSRVRTQAGLSILRRQINEKDKLSGVMDMMREGAIVTDSDFIIRYANCTAMNMLGILETGGSLDAVIKDKFGYAFDSPGENGRFVLERPDSVLYGPLFISAQHRRVDKPGGGVDSYVFVFKDVTEEHNRHKMKQDFLSLISHKLRTPLTVISGYSKLLRELAPDEKLKDVTEGLLRSSLIMENLIQRILYFVEIENTPKTGSHGRLYIREITDRFGALYNKTCELTTPADAVDAEYWQIIAAEELIGNAFKFSNKGKVALNIQAGKDRLVVEDNGPGISAEEREKVLEPFYQGYKYFTGNTEGAGLGLSVVKRLAELNKCGVTLETGVSGGLKVTISKKAAEPAVVL
jgi:signal transduction histidine kinase